MDPFDANVAQAWPPAEWHAVTVVVGVSGGPDSVALLRSLVRLHGGGAGKIVVAHFEHGWRPQNERLDSVFVGQLAESLGLPFERASAGKDVAAGGEGREGAARHQRFAFFHQVAQAYGARFVALGHTWDDHIETILHRILRGTGPIGMAGIPHFRPLGEGAAIVHPLRDVTRDQVLAYLARLEQAFRTDETNRDRSLTRNRIRHELLPLLRRDFNPRVDEALARLGEWAELYRQWVPRAIAPLWEEAVRVESPSRVVIDCRPLQHEPRLAVLELLREVWRDRDWPQQSMDARTWQQLTDWAIGDDAVRATLPGTIQARRRAAMLVLERVTEP